MIDDLVNGDEDKIDRHNLDHRAQPEHRRADRQPDEALLGDRRVDHALFAELGLQPFGDAVRPLELADLLAH